jgi:hypothetical protein
VIYEHKREKFEAFGLTYKNDRRGVDVAYIRQRLKEEITVQSSHRFIHFAW